MLFPINKQKHTEKSTSLPCCWESRAFLGTVYRVWAEFFGLAEPAVILVQPKEELELTTQLHDVYNSELQGKFKRTHAREIFKVRHPGIEVL